MPNTRASPSLAHAKELAGAAPGTAEDNRWQRLRIEKTALEADLVASQQKKNRGRPRRQINRVADAWWDAGRGSLEIPALHSIIKRLEKMLKRFRRESHCGKAVQRVAAELVRNSVTNVSTPTAAPLLKRWCSKRSPFRLKPAERAFPSLPSLTQRAISPLASVVRGNPAHSFF